MTPQQPATNALANETSPYLLQHSHNAVDWLPWGKDALQLARNSDKPILLSIGYSACHWCHVMAHESFEDPSTAQVMNSLYVNIKVDREERPDLDKIYQSAHQLLNQRGGGWPLTVILTPEDRTPFFAGTYFPNEPRHGMPAFRDILKRVESFYREHRSDILKQNHSLCTALQEMHPQTTLTSELTAVPLDLARRELQKSFDSKYAGFGAAPKFPHPTNIERLLRHWVATCTNGKADQQALDMARFTLHAMASGGIYDQLGGGFCRYSVDERWMIPHFEKMLYDNGPLLCLYAEAWSAKGDEVFQRIAQETGQWVMREMQALDGGYYSTLDADSEGEEGRFYVWTPQQVQKLTSAEEYSLLSEVYGFDQPANFEGHWHLHVYKDSDAVATEHGIPLIQAREHLANGRHKLFEAREQRVHPGRDGKILTAWNGLMIKGMASAGRRLQREDFIVSAQKALDFIHTHLFTDGRLLATYKNGQARLMAYLDDYAFVLDGILELLQARWRDKDLHFAIHLAEVLLSHFEDREKGGFYFTADDHEDLFHRPKPMLDEATPAGNGIAAYTLGRLGHLLGESRYLEAAERTLRCAWQGLNQYAYAHGALLLALEEHIYPPQTIVIRGEEQAIQPWLACCQQGYAPRRMSFAIPADSTLPGLLAERAPSDETIAYVCTGTACQAPLTTLEELKDLLAAGPC